MTFKKYLIAKNTQLRKTWEIITFICRASKNNNVSNKRILNIILCDNKLLLVSQTNSRLKDAIVQNIELGEKAIMLSSDRKGTKYNDVNAVFAAIAPKDGVNNVLMCSNYIRHNDLLQLIDLVQNLSQKFEINIWVDEADVNMPKNFVDKIKSRKDFINSLSCITATPKNLFKSWKEFEKFDCSFPYDQKKYTRFSDNIIRKKDNNCDIIEYIDNIVDRPIIKKHILNKKEIILCPAKWTKKDHTKVKDYWIEFGANVLVINGDGHWLYSSDDKPLNLKEILDQKYLSKGVNYELKTFYWSEDGEFLRQKPLVITGNICIGRGITLTSSAYDYDTKKYIDGNYFWIDRFIIHDSVNGNNEERYQMAGRATNNQKDLKDWKRIKIYCSREYFDNVKKHEDQLINYQRCSLQSINKIQWNALSHNETKFVYSIKKNIDLYDNYEELLENLKMLNDKELTKTYNPRLKQILKKTDKYGCIKRATTRTAETHQIDSLIKEIKAIQNINHFTGRNRDYEYKNGEKYARLYIGYRNKEDPNTAVWMLCVVKIIKTNLYE